VRGCAVVVASGEIDLTTAPGLRQALQAASHDAALVMLDLTLVTFIDSTGLAALLDANQHRPLGRQISLCLGCTGTIVRRVPETTHVNTMLPTHDALAEATAPPA
jgi:anti-sigma B factor antagonist